MTARFDASRLAVAGPMLPDSSHGDYAVYELTPVHANAAPVNLIATVGDSDLDVEVGLGGRFAWYAGKRESQTDFEDNVLELLLAISQGGWNEVAYFVEDTIVYSKIVIPAAGKKFRSSSRFVGPSTRFARRQKRVEHYEPW